MGIKYLIKTIKPQCKRISFGKIRLLSGKKISIWFPQAWVIQLYNPSLPFTLFKVNPRQRT